MPGRKKSVVPLAATVLILLHALLPLAAYDGVMSGERDLRVTKTEWFDIIYPPLSAQSAAVLASHADEIYTDICRTYGTEPFCRMPVVITPAQDQFNAYFASVPYNHIVVYDTPIITEMAVFSENLLATFRHECTHAVTYNLKNKFWRGVSAVFGDAISTAPLFITRGWAEGAAVTSESMSGEGRLNDEYSWQMVRQAKIEHQFPGYADVQGAADCYPQNSFYYFNAAFDTWLQHEYGMEKYARFWHKCVNFQTISAGVAFKSVYDISLNTAWRAFRDSVAVPDVAPSPLGTDGYSDAFALMDGESCAPSYWPQNNGGALYESLTSSTAGIAFTDSSCGSVTFVPYTSGVPADGETPVFGTPRTLFTRNDIETVRLCSDGTLMAVSTMSVAHAAPKAESSVYVLKSRTFHALPSTGLRDAAVITGNGNAYAAAVRTRSQQSSVAVFVLSLSSDGKRITAVTQKYELALPDGTTPFALADGGNGTIVFLLKDKLAWSIVFVDAESGAQTQYPLPGGMRARSVSWSGRNGSTDTYEFSYTMPGTMPRLAVLSINRTATDAELQLQQTDVSGGIYCPARIGGTNMTMYCGQFFRCTRLLAVDTEKITFSTERIAAADSAAHPAVTADTVAADGTARAAATSLTSADSSAEQAAATPVPNALLSAPYHPLRPYLRGTFIPLTLMSTYMTTGTDLAQFPLMFGATYISSDPWSSSIVIASAGYSPFTNSGGMLASLSGGTATSLFSYTLQGQVEFDQYGYKQTADMMQLASTVPVGTHSYLVARDTCTFIEGRQSDYSNYKPFMQELDKFEDDASVNLFGYLKCTGSDSFLYGVNELSCGITTIHKTGPGFFERGGMSVSAAYTAGYSTIPVAPLDKNEWYQNIGATALVRVPRLIPVICAQGFTYNLPAKCSLGLFTSQKSFLTDTASVVLFSYELQKAIPFAAVVYWNRITVTGEYSGYFANTADSSWAFCSAPELTGKLFSGALPYYDAAGLGVAIDATPNFGTAANYAYCIDCKGTLLYYIRPDTKRTSPFGLSLSVELVY